MKRILAVLLILCLLLALPALAGEEPPEETDPPSSAQEGNDAAPDSPEAPDSPAASEPPEEEAEASPEADGPEEAEGSEEGFPEAGVYRPGQFSDVAENRWYGAEGQGVIRMAWELDLMVGMGDGTFRPERPLRLCEAVKLAAVLHSRAIADGAEFPPSQPWYRTYVDYAEAEGILQPGEFADLSADATRGEMAHILAAALPEENLPHINAIFAIPDVISTGTPPVTYYRDILRLYRAGVLLGDKGSHNFRPGDTITRAETAASVVRLALPETRQRLELLSLAGNAGEIPDAFLLRDTGERLTLGYHPWEEFFSFVGEDVPSEAADLFVSLDWDEYTGYPVYGEEGSLVHAVYPGFNLDYLIPDRDPQGVYIFRLEGTEAGMEDGRGIRKGTALRSLLEAFPDPELIREEEGGDTVWFTCLLPDSGVEYRYAISWDGRVSSFSQAAADRA